MTHCIQKLTALGMTLAVPFTGLRGAPANDNPEVYVDLSRTSRATSQIGTPQNNLSIDGKPFDPKLVSKHKPGDIVRLKVLKGPNYLAIRTVTVRLDTYPYTPRRPDVARRRET